MFDLGVHLNSVFYLLVYLDLIILYYFSLCKLSTRERHLSHGFEYFNLEAQNLFRSQSDICISLRVELEFVHDTGALRERNKGIPKGRCRHSLTVPLLPQDGWGTLQSPSNAWARPFFFMKIEKVPHIWYHRGDDRCDTEVGDGDLSGTKMPSKRQMGCASVL